VGFNACYTQGAAGFCTSGASSSWQVYKSNTSVGVGWISDAVFGTGTDIELTQVWSALAFYEHVWNPKWRTAVGGGYVNVHYDNTAKNLINGSMLGGVCGTGVAGAGAGTFSILVPGAGNSCNPDTSFWEAYIRTQWNPVAQLDIGLELIYNHNNTAYKGAGIYTASVAGLPAANGSRPAVNVIDDQDVWTAMVRWQRNFYP
jgi:hypothetical protein